MWTCVLCHFEVPWDDVAVACRGGRCICLTCYLRVTGHTEQLSRDYARQFRAAANGA